MPFPNHPGKHLGEAFVTPDAHNEYHRRQTEDAEAVDPPAAVVLCYSRRLMAYLTETYDGAHVDHYYGDLYVFDENDGRVGVLGGFGIGAPTTAMLMDELVADGVETFLSVGMAGSLDETIELGEFVVCDRAIRDEGTSHHYVESARFAHASESLTEATERLLTDRAASYHVGPSWTIDAIYRETVAEVERYAEEGVLTVEMEAAAVFAVAEARSVEVGSMFVVSDYLGTGDWEPKFHEVESDLQRLGDTATDLLASYVG
ncbi:nucleoside phosphorylase [Halomarina salina]|uniref:Nucleoside phosphorylase n=1 Tax=Halomarina salina TaxID=1872699 RepID=A0ABD5RHT2_9EURY|nr:nucleoside phosphorylase [Halomarina salina]